MRALKFLLSFAITLALTYVLDNRWVVEGNPIPPLGKFLDPFHGFWQNIQISDEPRSLEIKIPGLNNKVTVVFDSLAIPHIFAANDRDLYQAQGYVTAMHRLWQMEFQTHAAAGRVTEITGPGKNGIILNYDRSQRRLGMVNAAEKSLDALISNDTSMLMIENYTEGVNAYIKSLTYTKLPFEYKLLNYVPESWSPLKCVLLTKSMAQTLNLGDKDIEMSNALKLYGKEVVDLLYPDRDDSGDPIVDKPGTWNFKSTIPDSIPLALPEELIQVARTSRHNPSTGSNNWAVSGSKTATGTPILCGDPHLDLNLPSLWYAIHLNAPGINCMGASLPGAPAVIIGFTDSIAWSMTNAQRDLVDWFKISFEDASKNKYMLDGTWTNSKKVVEAFHIRDEPVFYDTIIYTHWGPITYDESFHAGNNLKHYAFRWITHDPSNEFISFYKLNRAKNHEDYMNALDGYASPAQNFVFASVGGDIAMRVQGKYPVRRNQEGKFVLDGSKSSNGWQAFIPDRQNVMDKNPKRGFVSSANQYPVDNTYPYYITGKSFENYRNRRINKVLSESSGIKPSDMMGLQNDNFNLKASESLPIFLQSLDTTSFTADERQAYLKLKSWDYYNAKDSEGASYYEAWWNNLMPLIWDELEREKIALSRPTTFNTIKLIKEKPDLEFFDILQTRQKETATDVIRQAFSFGVEDIRDWITEHTDTLSTDSIDVIPAWAPYKNSYLTHLLRIEPMNVQVLTGGGRDIVNAHSRTHGPSWRMVVSLEKSGIKAWATYPGGQSGDPGSVHYKDLLGQWLQGGYFLLDFPGTADQVPAKGYSITLNPAQ